MEVNVKLVSTFRKYRDTVNDDKAHLKKGSTVIFILQNNIPDFSISHEIKKSKRIIYCSALF